MNATTRSLNHAGGLYRRALRRPPRPIEKLEHGIEHLHDIEARGESGETPFIAMAGVILFLLPIAAFIAAAAFIAYYVIA